MKIQFLFLATFILHTTKVRSTANDDRFFIIGHMQNDISSANEAIRDGANALEVDLNFNKKDGTPTKVWRGYPCDESIFKPFECDRSSPYKDMLEFISKDTSLALIVLEGKVGSLSTAVQMLAGKNTVKAIEEYAFDKGFKGTIVIANLNTQIFIESASEQASVSKYKSQIYFTFLMDYSGADSVIRLLQKVAWPNIIYSIGSFTIYPRANRDDIRRASLLKGQGAVSNAFTWTINWESGFTNYYNSGARGITTNKVKKLSKWATRKGLFLARPGDGTLRPASRRLPPVNNGVCGRGCIVGVSLSVLIVALAVFAFIFRRRSMNKNAYGYERM